MTDISKLVDSLSEKDREELLDKVRIYKESLTREKAQDNFMDFVHTMWPTFIDGAHHKVMAKKFQQIAEGKLKRLIINMPPRHT